MSLIPASENKGNQTERKKERNGGRKIALYLLLISYTNSIVKEYARVIFISYVTLSFPGACCLEDLIIFQSSFALNLVLDLQKE